MVYTDLERILNLGYIQLPNLFESKGSAKEVQVMIATMAVENHGRQCKIEAFAILGSW